MNRAMDVKTMLIEFTLLLSYFFKDYNENSQTASTHMKTEGNSEISSYLT